MKKQLPVNPKLELDVLQMKQRVQTQITYLVDVNVILDTLIQMVSLVDNKTANVRYVMVEK